MPPTVDNNSNILAVFSIDLKIAYCCNLLIWITGAVCSHSINITEWVMRSRTYQKFGFCEELLHIIKRRKITTKKIWTYNLMLSNRYLGFVVQVGRSKFVITIQILWQWDWVGDNFSPYICTLILLGGNTALARFFCLYFP